MDVLTGECTEIGRPWLTVFSTVLQFAECTVLLCVFLEQVTWLIISEVRSKRFELITERRHDMGVICAVTHIFAYWTSLVSVTQSYFSSASVVSRAFSALCARYACIHSSGIILTPRLLLCQISIAELSHGEKLRTQSLNHSVIHSPSLFDVPGTEASKPRMRVLVERVHSVLLHHRTRIHQLLSSGWFEWLHPVFSLIRRSAGEGHIQSLCGLRTAESFLFLVVWQSLTAVVLVSEVD